MGFFFSSRGRHTRFDCDWSSDVCSSDLDLRNVRALEEVSEQRDELRALARRPSLPVTAEAPLRDLREVENLVRDPAQRGPKLRRLRVVLEPEARHRCGRTHRLPATPQTGQAALAHPGPAP